MKTVLILAGLVALASAKTVNLDQIHTKHVEPEFVEHLKKVLSLFKHIENVDTEADYYKVGHDYDVEANIDNYTNREAVEDFLKLYRSGFLPKYLEFSIFYERMRDEAIALFNLFYYAKDFETFYKTAAYARVHHNQGQFLYAYYIAILQRKDTHGFVLPAPYEVYPQLFTNWETQTKIIKTKMMDGLTNPTLAAEYGIFVENDDFVFYSNYSNSLSYPDEEQRVSYLTEDIGWNSYYYFFHSHLPFWWNSNKFGTLKERRGEIYFYFYQQLMARYYLERLTNGLDNTPQFSWFSPIKTGYYPALTSKATPFAQRSEYFDMHTVNNYEEVRFLDAYEKSFFQFLQRGHFKAYEQEIDFHNPKAVNFVGNYWQANADLYGLNVTQDYQRSYEIIARRVLGAAPKPFDKYSFVPSSLDFYQTSLRDPAFYQLYNRILDYSVQFKEYLKPHPTEDLRFVGVKVNDVKVDKLVTFFEHYDFEASNMLSYGKDQLTSYPHNFKVRQARLNQKPFTVTVDIKSDVATDAVIKFFLGPKYDNEGYPFNIKENWMNFIELDWFKQKLTPGQNTIIRKSENFTIFKEDSLSMAEIYKLLDNGLIPYDQSVEFSSLPRRLMLPRGTHGGYPFQMFVVVYPFVAVDKDVELFEAFILDDKPFGYPLDRPVKDPYFKQPNMFFKDVLIHHEGHLWAYKYNVPSELVPSNMVPKS